PFKYGGFPVFAEGEGGFLHPFNLIVWFLLPPVSAMNLTIIFHAALLGFGMFCFTKKITRSSWAALPAGVAAAVCGSIIAGHTRHLNALEAIALAPWLLLAAENFLTTARWLSHALTFGLLLGLALLTGHPQFAFITGSLASIYLLLRWWPFSLRLNGWLTATGEKFESVGRVRLRALALFFGTAVALAAAIAFPQLKSTSELAFMSQRREALPASFVGHGSLPWNGFLTFINPYFLGNAADASFKLPEVYFFWEFFHYTGVITAVLALFGLYWGWRKSGAVRALGGVSLISYLLALGENFPLYRIFSFVPLVRSFRFQARWLLGAELGLIALAAFGLFFIAARLAEFKAKTWQNGNRKGRNDSSAQKAKPKKYAMPEMIVAPPMQMGLGFAAFIALEIFIVAGSQVRTEKAAVYLTPSSAVAAMRRTGGALFTLGAGEVHSQLYARSGGWNGDHGLYGLASKLMPPNLGTLHHVPVINGYVALVPDYVAAVWGSSQQPGVISQTASLGGTAFQPRESFRKVARMFGVRFFTTAWQMPPPFINIWDSAGLRAYELPDVFPKAWIVGRVDAVGADAAVAATALIKESFDPLTTAVAAEPIALPNDAANGAAEILESSNHSMKLRANTAGLVVVQNTWYPAWRASADGAAVKVHRVNAMMQGVVAPKAGSVIELKFDGGLTTGWLWLSQVLIAASLLYAYFDTRKNRATP
ncbi:MAG: hypothetical protein IAF08_02240, partial [Rhizobacter sp.]|nr:hypothetical protein [Chlorobiales bacterium]